MIPSNLNIVKEKKVKKDACLTIGVETLMRNLLVQAAASFPDRTHVAISWGETTLEKPSTEFGAEL